MQYRPIIKDSTTVHITAGQTIDSDVINNGSKNLMLMSNGTIWNNIPDDWCKRCGELTPTEKEQLQWTYLFRYRTLVQFQSDFGSRAWRMAFHHHLFKHIRIWRNGRLELYNIKGEL